MMHKIMKVDRAGVKGKENCVIKLAYSLHFTRYAQKSSFSGSNTELDLKIHIGENSPKKGITFTHGKRKHQNRGKTVC